MRRRIPESMDALARYCAFRAGWQVFHAGRHEDYETLTEAARAGYDAARGGCFADVHRAYDAWIQECNARVPQLRVIRGRKEI